MVDEKLFKRIDEAYEDYRKSGSTFVTLLVTLSSGVLVSILFKPEIEAPKVLLSIVFVVPIALGLFQLYLHYSASYWRAHMELNEFVISESKDQAYQNSPAGAKLSFTVNPPPDDLWSETQIRYGRADRFCIYASRAFSAALALLVTFLIIQRIAPNALQCRYALPGLYFLYLYGSMYFFHTAKPKLSSVNASLDADVNEK